LATGIPARLSAREGRKFGLTVGIAFAVLGGVAWWRGRATVAIVFWSVGGLLMAAGLAVPTTLGPVQRAWMGLAHAISKVTTPIFMAIVYFVVLLPVGLVMRMFGRNPLTTHHSANTVWVSRGQNRRGDLERQF
jgi:Saxitoxin biosynthesis operon protein SxtJ